MARAYAVKGNLITIDPADARVAYIHITKKSGTKFTLIIDADKVELASKFTWHINDRIPDLPYGLANIPNSCISIHRVVTNAPKELMVDHIDGNTLDNRLSNLRLVENKHNCQNRKKAREDSSTGIRGVTFHNGKYRARLMVDGVDHFLGSFEDIGAAEVAAITARSNLMPYSYDSRSLSKDVLTEERT